VAAGVLLLAGLLGVGMTHVISAPLSRLTQIAQQIAQGDLGRRLRWPQRDEIGLLAQSFDTMAETLEVRFTEQQMTYASLMAQHTEQQRLLDIIADLETPIIPLGRGVLLAPLVGSLDARRMEVAGSSILKALTEQRARKVILDLTGVALADSTVVQQLLEIVRCVRLLGAEALFTGMRGDTALMLVQLGIDVQEFQSVATLEAGIESMLNAV
jgi:rsbT co-antagonist protein RsbR